MEFQKCIETRRSIRNFNSKEVSNDIIEEIVNAAAYAPSWKNSQVTRYYAIKDAKVKDAIIEAMPDFNKPSCKSAPVIIVSSVVKFRSGYTRDGGFDSAKGDGWQMYDCGLSNMIFLLKAKELGLGTVILGIFDEAKVTEIVGIPDTEEIVSVIPIGYFDEEVAMPKRKFADTILKVIE
ncbi:MULTISPECIES: nitroreductase family protein [unclassified Clostridium]|uniref:nitroreductase family protein n=1 Tax=unclassified Clostridium TaxID=2614128 RepID=UPI0032164C9B